MLKLQVHEVSHSDLDMSGGQVNEPPPSNNSDSWGLNVHARVVSPGAMALQESNVVQSLTRDAVLLQDASLPPFTMFGGKAHDDGGVFDKN